MQEQIEIILNEGKYNGIPTNIIAEQILSLINSIPKACPLFCECKNKLKDKHCDDNMNGSMYCFKK